MDYLEKLAKCKSWRLFFTESEAKKAESEAKKQGNKTKIMKEKGANYTLFIL